MKMKPEHYDELLQAIRRVAPYAADHRKCIIVEGKSKNVEMRLRWDCLYASKLNVCAWYDYLNDSHLDTALRTVMNELGLAK
jgi:hypothetical protein